jgi:hypothetical protein
MRRGLFIFDFTLRQSTTYPVSGSVSSHTKWKLEFIGTRIVLRIVGDTVTEREIVGCDWVNGRMTIFLIPSCK